MTLAGLSKFERFFDRVAPALILALGLTVSAAFVAAVGA
jgi:hypothetical protein